MKNSRFGVLCLVLGLGLAVGGAGCAAEEAADHSTAGDDQNVTSKASTLPDLLRGTAQVDISPGPFNQGAPTKKLSSATDVKHVLDLLSQTVDPNMSTVRCPPEVVIRFTDKSGARLATITACGTNASVYGPGAGEYKNRLGGVTLDQAALFKAAGATKS